MKHDRLSLAVAITCALVGTGCKQIMGYGEHTPAPIPQFSGDAKGLEAFGRELLSAAIKDDRNRVHDLLASTIMTPAQLSAVIGVERAQLVQGRYTALMETLVNRGAIELVAQIYERKYDSVEVLPTVDAKVTAALAVPREIFSLRLKKASEAAGLRYDFFVYLDGRWVTGNQLGKFL